MRVAIIVAAAENDTIGRDNDLPWHLSADLKRFKRLTMGHHLIMGRKTLASIGRPLPGRTTIVLSRHQPELPPGVLLATSLEGAIEIARRAGDAQAFVAGGAQVYRLALDVADRIYLTRVHADFDGDARLPPIDTGVWRLAAAEHHAAGDLQPLAFSFLTYERIEPRAASRAEPGAPASATG